MAYHIYPVTQGIFCKNHVFSQQDGGCRYNSGAVRAYPSGYSQISANPSSIINALQSGPVSIAVNAIDSFMSYSYVTSYKYSIRNGFKMSNCLMSFMN